MSPCPASAGLLFSGPGGPESRVSNRRSRSRWGVSRYYLDPGTTRTFSRHLPDTFPRQPLPRTAISLPSFPGIDRARGCLGLSAACPRQIGQRAIILPRPLAVQDGGVNRDDLLERLRAVITGGAGQQRGYRNHAVS